MLLDRLFSTRQACSKRAALRGLLDSIKSFLLTTSLIIELGLKRIKRRAFLSVNKSREMRKGETIFAGVIRRKEEKDQTWWSKTWVFSFCLLFCLLMHDTSLRSSSFNLLCASRKNVCVSVH